MFAFESNVSNMEKGAHFALYAFSINLSQIIIPLKLYKMFLIMYFFQVNDTYFAKSSFFLRIFLFVGKILNILRLSKCNLKWLGFDIDI